MRLIKILLFTLLAYNGYSQNIGTRQVRGLTTKLNTKLDIADTANIRLRANAGTNMTITGTYPNLTFNSTASGGGSSSSIVAPVWDRRGPVMTAATSADQDNAFEPTVILDSTTSPTILTGFTKVFRMWYTTGWTVPQINYAESLDGATWTRYSGNPVVSNHARSFVIKNGSTFVMYASLANTGNQIDRYTSTDGITWTLANAAVISKVGGWNSQGLYNMSVIIDGGVWKMIIDGATTGQVYSQGYYTSPDGITWTPYASNPVLSGKNEGSPFLKKIGSTYWLWCGPSGTSGVNLPTDIARYSSPDMITWTRNPTENTFKRRTDDEGPFNSVGQVQDVYMTSVDTSVYMYYSASKDGSQQSGKLRIKLAIAPMDFATLVTTKEGDNAVVPLGIAGSENYVLTNGGGYQSADSSFRYNAIGLKSPAGNTTGLLISPTVTARGANDTLFGVTITPKFSSNGWSNPKIYDLKINKTFFKFDSLFNFSIGTGGAAQPTTSNSGTFFVGNGAGNAATTAYNSTFIGPSAGQGATNANASNFIGGNAGFNATGAFSSNFIGGSAGQNATGASNSNFLGAGAGSVASTSSASSSNFFGQNAGNAATGASNSNFFGSAAGQTATSAQQSNFFGNSAGKGATSALLSNFFGSSAGQNATGAQQSNFLGNSAGSGATGASYSNFIGFNNGNSATFAITGSNNILLGTNITTPAAASTGTLNIGNVLYGAGLNGTTTGNPTNTPKPLGQIGIGVTTPAAGAVLDITSTTMGVLFPRMTTAQRTAITLVAANDGLMVYDTDFHKLFLNENGTWVQK